MRIDPVPDGPVWHPLTGRAAEHLTVYGVRLQVEPEELRRLANRLDRAGAEVTQALEFTRRAAATLESTTAYAPASGSRAGGSTWTAWVRRSFLIGAMAGLADDLRTASWRYLDAERAAQQHLVWPRMAPPGPVCQTSPPVSVLGGIGDILGYPGRLIGVLGGTVAESLVHGRLTPSDAQTGHLLREATSFLDAGGILQGAGSVHVFSALVNRVTTRGISTRVRTKEVAPPVVDRPRAGPVPPPLSATPAPTTSLHGLVSNVGDLYPQYGAEPNTVRVDRMVKPDGTVAWQVFIPGTQSAQGLWGGDSPNDWASNAQIHGRQESAASSAVIAAMRAAGVGRDEPVLITGHSQGGMVAADLAAREQVRAEFSIASVLSIGSPVGHIDIPDGVAALHLEHTDDLVAGLDGQINPVTPDRTTITRDVNATSPWYPFGHVGLAHDVPAYEQTAQMADASHDAAVRNWYTASAAMLDVRAEVTSTYVQSTRVD